MNLKKIHIIGLVLLLFFFEVKTNNAFARTRSQYQLYRLSDDPSDDRRPKLAINDQGTVWVAWESNRDGDFDIWGRKFESGSWSNLVEISQDTNETLLCDILVDLNDSLLVLGTETDLSKIPYPWAFTETFLFCQPINTSSLSEKRYLAHVHHSNPFDERNREFYPTNLPKISFNNYLIITCYRRGPFTFYNHGERADSLFLIYKKDNLWFPEICDSVFIDVDLGVIYFRDYYFPLYRINLSDYSVFLIIKTEDWHFHGAGSEVIALVIDKFIHRQYISLNMSGENFLGELMGFAAYSYGSSRNSIFYAGFDYMSDKKIIRRVAIKGDSCFVTQNEWKVEFQENIKMSQMSNLVAFVWHDSNFFYIKTFQDSLWFITSKIPLDGIENIGYDYNCYVYNNEVILITFDAITNGNKEIYTLSVPVIFEIDTTLTSINLKAEHNLLPIDFELNQNYPNPFNSSTEIRYSLPQDKSSYFVELKIYDIRGRFVNILVEQDQTAGTYSVRWDGRDLNGNAVASGLYFYVLKMNNSQLVKKMLLLQ